MPARPLSEEEYSRVIQHLATQGRHRDRLLVVFACASGFRITELLSLRFMQLYDCAAGEVAREVTIPRRDLKGGRGRHKRSVRGRRVPLGEGVRAEIAAYIRTLPEPPAPHASVFRTSRSRGQVASQAREWGPFQADAVADFAGKFPRKRARPRALLRWALFAI